MIKIRDLSIMMASYLAKRTNKPKSGIVSRVKFILSRVNTIS